MKPLKLCNDIFFSRVIDQLYWLDDEETFISFVEAFQDQQYFEDLRFFVHLKKVLLYGERVWPQITVSAQDIRDPKVSEMVKRVVRVCHEVHFLNIPNFIDYCTGISDTTNVILSLEDMALNSGHVYDLLKYVKGNLCISALNLFHNEIDALGCLSMARIMTTNMNLRELDLNSNNVGDSGACIISSSLLNSNVKKLKLANNGLSPVSCAAIASKSWGLEEFDLSQNNIEPYGASWIAESLVHSMCGLRSLFLCNSNLKREGCLLICQALCSTQTFSLETIAITGEHDSFDDSCMALFSDALKVNRFHWVNLSDNAITDYGVELLDAGISFCKPLAEIHLTGNHISMYGIKILEAIPNVNIIAENQRIPLVKGLLSLSPEFE